MKIVKVTKLWELSCFMIEMKITGDRKIKTLKMLRLPMNGKEEIQINYKPLCTKIK